MAEGQEGGQGVRAGLQSNPVVLTTCHPANELHLAWNHAEVRVAASAVLERKDDKRVK
jgi:hypothetical protein